MSKLKCFWKNNGISNNKLTKLGNWWDGAIKIANGTCAHITATGLWSLCPVCPNVRPFLNSDSAIKALCSLQHAMCLSCQYSTSNRTSFIYHSPNAYKVKAGILLLPTIQLHFSWLLHPILLFQIPISGSANMKHSKLKQSSRKHNQKGKCHYLFFTSY